MIISLFCFIYYVIVKAVKWIQKVFSGNVFKELIGIIFMGIVYVVGIPLYFGIGIVAAILQVLLGVNAEFDQNKWIQKADGLNNNEDDEESDEDEEEEEEEESVFDEEIDEEESK